MLRETPTECRVVAQDLERIFNRLFTITTPIPITSTASAIESNQLQRCLPLLFLLHWFLD